MPQAEARWRATEDTMTDLPGSGVPPAQFFGQFRLKIDEKGRLTLPATHRNALPESAGLEFVVRRSGKDACLQLIPKPEWHSLAARRRGQTDADGEQLRWQQRTLYSQAEEVVLDVKGRMAISRERLSAVGISDEAIVVGVNRILELWEPQAFLNALDQKAAAPSDVDDLLYE
jgi:MraZ protein